MTPLLLDWFANTQVSWAPAAQADMVVVGSILEHIPRTYRGLVAGVGKMHRNSVIQLPRATVLGVRGPLSAQGFVRNVSLGDPGLLAPELVPPVSKQYNLGLIGHWSDSELGLRPEFARYNPLIIRPDGDPLDVIRQIGSCRKIVSSSLHGIIVADGFGIPRRIEMCKRFEREGGSFKFEDHNAAVGVPFMVGVTQIAPRYAVQTRQHELYDMFRGVGRRSLGAAA